MAAPKSGAFVDLSGTPASTVLPVQQTGAPPAGEFVGLVDDWPGAIASAAALLPELVAAGTGAVGISGFATAVALEGLLVAAVGSNGVIAGTVAASQGALFVFADGLTAPTITGTAAITMDGLIAAGSDGSGLALTSEDLTPLTSEDGTTLTSES